VAFRYLDHEADVGIEAVGATVEEAFAEGARAMCNLMVDLDCVEPTTTVAVHCEAANESSLFASWLNELISQMDLQGLIFSRFEVGEIRKCDDGYVLDGVAHGEPFDPARHPAGTEVKAATYSGLEVTCSEGGYVVRCVLDV